jgi:hypothetical protein
MPKTQPPRTPSANVEGRDNPPKESAQIENFALLARRLLKVSREELKDKEQIDAIERKSKKP